MKFPNTDFSGGQVDPSLLITDKSEALALSGLDHSAGNLQVMKAPEQIPLASDNPVGGGVADAFVTIRDYVTPNGDTILVGKRGGSLWFGTQYSWRRKLLYGVLWEYDMLNSDDNGFLHIYNGLPSAINHGTTAYRLQNGNVRYVDGDSYIDTANAQNALPSAMHFSIWTKPDVSMVADKTNRILLTSTTGSKGIRISSQYGKLQCTVYGAISGGSLTNYSTFTTNAVMQDQNFHLIQVTWTNGEYPVIYIDGVQVAQHGSGTAVFLVDMGTDTMLLGASLNPNWYGWIGLIGTASHYVGSVPAGFLDQYTYELPRYTNNETPLTWKPFLGRSLTASTYLSPRTYLRASERFQQVGSNLYCTPSMVSADDFPIRWSGFYFDQGRALMDATNGYIRLDKGYDNADGFITVIPPNAGIRSGDTIYFATWDVTSSKWIWDIKNGRVIKNVITEGVGLYELELHASYVTEAKGRAETSYSANHLRYVIVRTHRVGVPEMPDLTAASSATAGTLPIGKYEYVAEYGSDLSGYQGLVAISNIITLSAAGSIQLSGWPVSVPEKDVDWIKIYRSYDDNSGAGFDTPKLVHTVARSDIYTALVLPANWTDTGVAVDSDNPLASDSDLRSRPGAISSLSYFNQRLFGFDGPDLVASTLGKYEYFPNDQWSASSSSDVNTNIGLRIPIGAGTAEPITAIVPEDGAYASTGNKGNNLLILLRKRAVRWFGTDRSDFESEPAFAEGAVSSDFVMNAGGMIVFGSDHHVFALIAGSNAPAATEGRMWNRGLPVSAVTLKKWKCAYWNGWYLFLGTETEGGDPDTLYMYNVAKGTWTSVPGNYLDIFVPSDDPTRNVLVSGADGNVYDLFASTTAQSIKYQTGRLSLESTAGEITDYKHVRLVRMFVRPATTSDVDLTITMLGDNTSSASSKTVTVPKGTDRFLIKVEVPLDAVNPALKITSDNAVWPFQIDLYTVECGDPHGDGTGVN